MSYAMLHGLGDCTPEHNCGCLAPPMSADLPDLDSIRDRYLALLAFVETHTTWLAGQIATHQRLANETQAAANNATNPRTRARLARDARDHENKRAAYARTVRQIRKEQGHDQ